MPWANKPDWSKCAQLGEDLNDRFCEFEIAEGRAYPVASDNKNKSEQHRF